MERQIRRRRFWLIIGLCALVLLVLPSIMAAFRPNGVVAAWDRARAAGAYRFDSDVTQLTVPVATVGNIGTRGKEDRLHLEGSTNLHARTMELKLWNQGGSVLEDQTGVSVRVEDDKTQVRQGTGPWKAIDGFTDTIAPAGDFMAYLTAVRDVQSAAPETRAGVTYTRHTFQIDAPAFAGFMRDQMEHGMRAEGSLPHGTHVDIPRYYLEMVGNGELWVGSDGMPLRQILHLEFPEGKGERVSADIVVNFSDFAQPSLLSVSSIGRALIDLGSNPTPLFNCVIWIGVALLLVRFRRSRGLQRAVPVVMIAALVLGPLLTNMQIGSFLHVQEAKAAEQEQQRQESDMKRAVKQLQSDAFDPHSAPLAAAQLDTQQAALETTNATAAQEDNGDNSDQDDLTDWEEEQVGTDPKIADTDADLIDDAVEIKGVKDADNKLWYMNALDIDTNHDTLPDKQEYDRDGNQVADDIDNDKTPDVFDADNDGDGVPDAQDLSPFTRAGAADSFNEGRPLSLTLENLTMDKPTFVEFQVRPTEEGNLWFARNVLDWPSDSAGQIQDRDDKTFAQVKPDDRHEAGDAWGDMKLVPMLEIRLPDSPTKPLTLPGESALNAYGIKANKIDDNTMVAYVPLSIVTDPQTGRRVAFSGRMLYQLSGTWTGAHDVRLVWVVQALVDQCKDIQSGKCVDNGEMNDLQVVHAYYDTWTLTGLNVREDHGAKVAIVYEEPAVDTPATAATIPGAKSEGAGLLDDRNLFALANGLDNHFLNGRDGDNNKTRDVTIDELYNHFELGNITDVNDERRLGTPDIFRVDTPLDANDRVKAYGTLDEAVASTTTTETQRILVTKFEAELEDHAGLTPLLMYAREEQYRGYGLDALAYNGPINTSIRIDMAPVTIDTITGLSWSAYCAIELPKQKPEDKQEVQWEACDRSVYWKKIAERHTDTTKDAYEAAGEVLVGQLYYLSLANGANNVVQVGPDVQTPGEDTPVESKSETVKTTRTAANAGKQAVAAVANKAILKAYEDETFVKKSLGRIMNNLDHAKLGPTDPGMVSKVASKIKAFASGSTFRTTLVIGAAVVLIGGLGLGAGAFVKYYLAGNPSEQRVAAKLVDSLVIIFSFLISVAQPAKAAVDLFNKAVKAGKTAVEAFKSVALKSSTKIGNSRIAGAIGAVISVGIAVGFFIYAVVSNNIDAFSPQFNKLLSETIATTIFVILTAVLSASVIGLILVSLIAVLDAILTAICEGGDENLKDVPGMDGACFTVSGAATKAIAKMVYAYDLMVDMEPAKNDLVATGTLDVQLGDQTDGYVAGNPFNVSLPVTTTIRHKDPGLDSMIMMWQHVNLFSEDNIRGSTFKYSLTRNKEDLSAKPGEMRTEWGVEQDHKLMEQQLYRAKASTTVSLVDQKLQPGINQALDFYLNMGYAVPAFECWGLGPLLPVCYERTFDGKNSSHIEALTFDIFPATLDGFMKLSAPERGGHRLAWDARFPILRDADGDGVQSAAHSGADPDDKLWDTDGDGLSDRFELDRRAAGVGFSPVDVDTDGDGLSDAQEMEFSTHPNRADTDNDGLSDGDEVYHKVYTLRNTWKGGWDVNVSDDVLTHVSSDPTLRDGDDDGISDGAEKQLAAQGFNPRVPNPNPLKLLVATDDADGFVRPGQTIKYITTVQREGAAMSQGVLEVLAPALMGDNPLLYTLALDQYATIVQDSILTVPDTVPADKAPDLLTISSSVRARLASAGGNLWAWNDPVSGKLGSEKDQPGVFSEVAANSADRADSFVVSTLTSDSARRGGTGAVSLTPFPAGSPEVSASPRTADVSRGAAAPRIACAANGNCMTVWDQIDNCNELTIKSLKVEIADNDDGTNGIEPAILLDGKLLGSPYTQDLKAGDTRSVDVTQRFCGSINIEVKEWDGQEYWSTIGDTQTVYTNNIGDFDRAFDGDCRFGDCSDKNKVRLYFTIPDKQFDDVAGTVVKPDMTTVKGQFSLSGTSRSSVTDRMPVVTSNGTDFLVAWERTPSPFFGDESSSAVMVRHFDNNGDPRGDAMWVDTRDWTPDAQSPEPQDRFAFDVVGTGDRYRLVTQFRGTNTIRAFEINNQGWANRGDVGNAAEISDDYYPRLAYNPVSKETALVYRNTSYNGVAVVTAKHDAAFAAPTLLDPPVLLEGYSRSPRLAYLPETQGWLLAASSSSPAVYKAFTSDWKPLPGAADLKTAQVTGDASIVVSDIGLACPQASTAPIADLRFEELPGATAFADSSGRGNSATAMSGSARPSAGTAGAANAPVSDYAVRFDGADDYATMPKLELGDFSVAFWIKTRQQEAAGSPGWYSGRGIVDADIAGDGNDWGISLASGKLRFGVGGPTATTLESTTTVNDDAWHFVVATRQRATGAMNLYIDGALDPVASGTGSTVTLSAAATLGRIASGGGFFRGALDHLRIYPSTLAADTTRALYNREVRATCLVTLPDTNGWADYVKLQLQPNDTRGGVVDAEPAGLRLTVDDDKPTADVTSEDKQPYVQGFASGSAQTVIIGGEAKDTTSSVVKVEVSVDGAAYQSASGSATWTYALRGAEGVHTIRARATDAVGHVGDAREPATITIDATAPTIGFDPGTATMVPQRNDDGRWIVPFSGTVGDPRIGSSAGSGVNIDSVQVLVEGGAQAGIGGGWRTAKVEGDQWSLSYPLEAAAQEPTGAFTVTVRAADTVGNAAEVTKPLALDAAAPRGSLGKLDAERSLINGPLNISGTITETGSAGLARAEIAVVPIKHVVAQTNPVLQLALDGHDGDVLYPDTSPELNNARCDTATCPAYDAGGRIDGALRFDGTQIASVPHDATIDFAEAESFTVQTWFKASSSKPAGENVTLLTKRGDADQGYTLQLNGGTQLALELPGLNLAGGPDDTRDDTWHQAVAVVDRSAGAKQAKLYLDGKLVAEQDFTGAVSNTADLEIGGGSETVKQGFAGALDQIMLFDRALLAEEVASLYAAADTRWIAAGLGQPVALADGSGSVAAWTAAVPTGLEGQYQIDLRATDALNNRLVTGGIWRGIIDTLAPRLEFKGARTGAEYFDDKSDTRRFEIEYRCSAEDRNLSATGFSCPGADGVTPLRSFASDPSLEHLFPDWTTRDGLSMSYSVWETEPRPATSARACDTFGNCVDGALQLSEPAPTATPPQATPTATPTATQPPATPTATQPAATQQVAKPAATQPPATPTVAPAATQQPATPTPTSVATEPPATPTPTSVATEPPATPTQASSATPEAPASPAAETTLQGATPTPASDANGDAHVQPVGLSLRAGLAQAAAPTPTTTPQGDAQADQGGEQANLVRRVLLPMMFGPGAPEEPPAATPSPEQPRPPVAQLPMAVVVSPDDQQFVGASGGLEVVVAAEAERSLHEVTLELDGKLVDTASFEQNPGVLTSKRTIKLAVSGEGKHTLTARATDWAGNVQATVFPVTVTLDTNRPSLTLDNQSIGLPDTYGASSGIVRLRGDVADSMGLAAVQVCAGNGEFMDAEWDGNGWQTALYIGKALQQSKVELTVRAVDRAGQVSELVRTLPINLAPAAASN